MGKEVSIALHTPAAAFSLSNRAGDLLREMPSPGKGRHKIALRFTVDRDIFQDLTIQYDYFSQRIQQLAFLNPGAKLIHLDYRSSERQKQAVRFVTFCSPTCSIPVRLVGSAVHP